MAVERNEAVLKLVEDRLRKDPDQTTKDLKRAAEEIDDDIEELTPREFNARYPLQVKRKMAAEEKASGDGGAPAEEPAEKESGASGKVDEATRDRVYRMIEEALRDDPDVSNRILQERAAEIASSIGDLSARSFNARYPLQVKRRLAAERQEEEAEEGQPEAGAGRDELRDAVRGALLDFAKDVAGAEDRGKVIDVLLSVDDYVDGVMEKA